MYEYTTYLEAEQNGVSRVVCENILAEFLIILNSIAEVKTTAKSI
jgi:hypothetical protein